MNTKVEQIVTDRIVAGLKKGNIPWQKPWKAGKNGTVAYPCNAISKRPYSGINAVLLSMDNYTCPFYATYKQISDMGGNVRKGEKSTIIIYWNIIEKKKIVNGLEKTEKIPFLRYHNVFNLEQAENITIPEYTAPELLKSTDIIESYVDGPIIQHGGSDKAYYQPSRDIVVMPHRDTFITEDSYQQVMYHELIHSTGSEKRLNRLELGRKSYAYEELIAEIGSAMLCQMSGISWNVENTQAYINGWIEVLQNDPKLIISAGSKAQKAIDYMIGKEKEE